MTISVINNIRYWFCRIVGHKYISHVCQKKYIIKKQCSRCKSILFSIDEAELDKYIDEQENYNDNWWRDKIN